MKITFTSKILLYKNHSKSSNSKRFSTKKAFYFEDINVLDYGNFDWILIY